MLQETIRKAASGSPQVCCQQIPDIQIKMFQTMLQFEAAPADIALTAFQHQLIRRFDAIARLVRQAPIDLYLPGHDGAPGLFAAFAKPLFHERNIQASHDLFISETPGVWAPGALYANTAWTGKLEFATEMGRLGGACTL